MKKQIFVVVEVRTRKGIRRVSREATIEEGHSIMEAKDILIDGFTAIIEELERSGE